jgi:hypothetical protein
MRLGALMLVGLGWTGIAWSGVAQAQTGHDLASPWTRGAHAAPSSPRGAPTEPTSSSADPSEVQDLRALTAAESASAAPRVYGDGEGDSLGWDDPERDLQPMGMVHFVFMAQVAYLAGNDEFAEAIAVSGGPALDFCLWPALSLHLRVGLRLGGQGPFGVPSRRLSDGYIRGSVLLGIHAVQLVSIRLGAELGPELVFASDSSSGNLMAGGAAVAQLGIRPGGNFEIALDLAVDIRPGEELTPRGPTQYTYVTPRVGAMLAVTF